MQTLPVSVALAALLGAPDVGAQDAAPDRWRLAADLAFTATSGNSRVSLLSSGVRLTHLETDAYELEATTLVRYGRSRGEEVERSASAGLKLDVHPKDDWSPFVFVTLEHEPFRRLEARAYGGGGVKYTLWSVEEGKVSVSAAALYSMEELKPVEGAAVDPLRREVRSSWRVKATRAFSETTRFENTTFYQPILDRPGDYLVDVQTALAVQITRRVAIRLAHSYERDSTPPTGVRRDDQVTTVGFTLEL